MKWSGWKVQGSADGSSSFESPAEMKVIMIDAEAVNNGGLILHPIVDEALRDLISRGVFHVEPGATTLIPTIGALPEKFALFVICEKASLQTKAIRLASSGVGQVLKHKKISRLSWIISADTIKGGPTPTAAAEALAEGLLLSLYERDTQAMSGRSIPSLSIRFELESPEVAEEWDKGFQRGVQTVDGVCYARELVNLPGNALTPDLFAKEAVSLSEQYGFECKIYDEQEAASEGMGGLLAVGQGSANAPRMIVVHYKGDPDSKETVGLVGKGVTFDTGGYALKKWQGMEEMISDMGGAGTVFGTLRIIGERKPRINLVAVVPAAENMISGNAFKPGDVIKTYSGKTVEILNTDAEGRIVLADGLTMAIRAGATRLIDIATLTGAVMVALGDVTSGALTNDESFLQELLHASQRAGEYLWPLPSHAEYHKQLKSEVADLKNHGGPWGGAIFGGLFVGSFAEDLPWVHLDIGGTAWMWSDRPLEPKGGTGVLVRTLAEYLERT